jgi:hypothetical protein
MTIRLFDREFPVEGAGAKGGLATLNDRSTIRVRAWIAELTLLLTYLQGRGCGVGRSLDGGVPLGVGVGRGVVVAVAVAVAVGVGDGAPPTAAKISTRPQP